MKRNVSLVFAASSLCVILAASLGAQPGLSSTLKASIPFEFGVRGQTMPAGDYEVLTYSSGYIILRQFGGSHEAMSSVTYGIGYSGLGTQGALTFRRYGTQYFLAQVSRGNGAVIVGLSKSPAERELIKVALSQPVETVTVASLRAGR